MGIGARRQSSGVVPVAAPATVLGTSRETSATKNETITAKHKKDSEEKTSPEKLRSKKKTLRCFTSKIEQDRTDNGTRFQKHQKEKKIRTKTYSYRPGVRYGRKTRADRKRCSLARHADWYPRRVLVNLMILVQVRAMGEVVATHQLRKRFRAQGTWNGKGHSRARRNRFTKRQRGSTSHRRDMELWPEEIQERSGTTHIKLQSQRTSSNWKTTQLKSSRKHSSKRSQAFDNFTYHRISVEHREANNVARKHEFDVFVGH